MSAAPRRAAGGNAESGAGAGLGPFESLFYWPGEPEGFLFSARWIPEKPEHGQWYLNINYEILDNLRIGMDYRPLTRDASILANWRPISEDVDGWRPGLIIGTSNDDFGDIPSQSYYATLAKSLFTVEGMTVSLYGGGTYIAELEELRPVGGLHLRMDEWSALFMYSGVDEHFSISRDIGNHTISFVLFDLRLPGAAYSFRF